MSTISIEVSNGNDAKFLHDALKFREEMKAWFSHDVGNHVRSQMSIPGNDNSEPLTIAKEKVKTYPEFIQKEMVNLESCFKPGGKYYY